MQSSAKKGPSAAELKKENKRLRRALDASISGIVVFNKQGVVTFANQAWADMTGYGPNELLGQKWASFIVGKEHVAALKKWMAKKTARRKLRDEIKLKKKDGSEMWVVIHVTPSAPNKGTQEDFVVAARDISEEKEREVKLGETTQFLDTIIENIPDMIFIKEAKELRFLSFNKAGETLIGLPRSKMIGKNDYDFFPTDQATEFVKKDREVFRKKKILDIPSEPIKTLKNGTRLLHTKKVPIFDEKGKPKYLLGISEDITDSQKVVRQLRESEERFEQAFAYAPIGMAMVSPDGEWLKVNKALTNIIGFSEKTLLKKTFQDITHPDDLEIDMEHVHEMLLGKRETYNMEKRYIHKKGHIVWVHLYVSLVRDQQGRPVHFISQIQDITQKKKRQLEMETTLKQVETMNRLMVDRELRMVELKEQIKACRTEHGVVEGEPVTPVDQQ